MDNCAKCGKSLSWREKYAYWQRALKKGHLIKPGFLTNTKVPCPEFTGKKLCKPCMNGILKPVRYEMKSQGLSVQEINLTFKFQKANEEGRRVVVQDAVFSADGIGKHLEKTSRIAEKFGYVFKSESHTSDMFGNPSIFYMTFEKNVEARKFINCKHCTTRYDANQYFKCPRCGAPAT